MEGLNSIYPRAVNESSDPNIASARGVSTNAFLATLEVNIIVFVVLVLIFTILRRANRRIYAPRTYVGTIEPWRRLKTVDGDDDGYVDEVENVKGFSGLLGGIVSAWKIKFVFQFGCLTILRDYWLIREIILGMRLSFAPMALMAISFFVT